MADEVIKVLEEIKNILKIDMHVQKQKQINQQKIKAFKEKLETTMKFWPRNILD